MAVGLVDFSEIHHPRAAWVNGNVMMYAASLPKIAIMFAAFQAFENGDIKESSSVMNDIRNMIRVSSNASATRLIDLLGGFDTINQLLNDPKYKFFDPAIGGGLWVGKRYAKWGERKPEPLQGISHAASVAQVTRFYFYLVMGKLINPHRSAQMLEALSEPRIHHKFISYLEKKYSLKHLYRKSGTWKIWHADSVLVWEKER